MKEMKRADNMQLIYGLFAIMFLAEILALSNKFIAAVFYFSIIFVMFLKLLYKQIEEEKEIVIVFLTLPLIRLVQFLAPMQMLSYGWQILVIYFLLLVLCIMNSRALGIKVKELHNRNKLSELILLIPIFVLALFIGLVEKEITMSFSYFSLSVIIFATYVQALFFFGILQNKLEEKKVYGSILLVALLPVFFSLNGIAMLASFISMLIFSYLFSRTKNLLLILVPMLILNVWQAILF